MKLGFVIIYVSDVKEVMQFYTNAFGLKTKLEYEQEGVFLYGEMATEGAVLGFASHQMGQMNLNGNYLKSSIDNLPFGQEIVFVSEDVAKTYDTAIRNGAVCVSEPTDKPWGQTVAYVRAIEGTLIEICSPMNVD